MVSTVRLVSQYGLRRLMILELIAKGKTARQAILGVGHDNQRNYEHYDYLLSLGLVEVIGSGASRRPRPTPAGLAVLEELRKAQLEDLGESLKGEL